MTQDEFFNLKVGDTVYFYRTVNAMKIGTINAAIVKKKIDKIFDRDDGSRSISLEKGGALLKGIIHRFDTDKDKLLYTKMKDIRAKVNDAVNGPYRFKKYPNGLKRKYENLLRQKNIQPMLEKYPELLI